MYPRGPSSESGPFSVGSFFTLLRPRKRPGNKLFGNGRDVTSSNLGFNFPRFLITTRELDRRTHKSVEIYRKVYVQFRETPIADTSCGNRERNGSNRNGTVHKFATKFGSNTVYCYLTVYCSRNVATCSLNCNV